MGKLTENLEQIAEHIRLSFSERDAAREKMLPLCREVIRHSGNAIRAVHRREFEQARDLLKNARGFLDEAQQAADNFSELASAHYLKDAEKEFAEGNITLALVTRHKLPTPEELRVDYAPYLNGLGEAVGEVRRFLLDNLRKGDLSQGEELLSAMDDIYTVLVTMDFPDALTGGLRRTADNVRGILERTRSDLTLTIRQKELETKLEKLEHT
ncbi:MAG: haloacid dehalogenase [Chloroflexota bacterium]